MTDAARASAYLVLKATRTRYGKKNPETGLYPIEQVRVVAARQGRPEKLEKDEILIKVGIDIPISAFDPITPQALIVVPEHLVLAQHEIEVEAESDF